MGSLGLLASAILRQPWEAEQQGFQQANHQQISREFAPSTPESISESMMQVTPVYELEVQSTPESFTSEQREQQSDEVNDSEREVQPDLPIVSLEGEAILGVSSAVGKTLDAAVVLQDSVELKLNVSFTGKDFLEVGFESGSSRELSYIGELTFEGQLGYPIQNNPGRFELSELSYEFPIGDRASLYLSATGADLNEFNPLLGNGDKSGDGAISKFGVENPIHNLVEDVGAQFNYDLTDELSVSLGYFSGGTNNPISQGSLFSGNQSAFVQIGFEPSDRFLIGFSYIYTHNHSGLETETGSLRSQLDLNRPMDGHSYELAAFFAPSPRFAIGGWVGFTHVTVMGLGDADVWNYALTLAFPDFGQKGNLLGMVVGQEPKLTRTSGFTIDGRPNDPNTSLHLELFYRNRLSDHMSVTPGLVVQKTQSS